MRRTISNLSREFMISRPSIYRIMERLGISKQGQKELSPVEWDALIREIGSRSGTSTVASHPGVNQSKQNRHANNFNTDTEAINSFIRICEAKKTSDREDAATVWNRLKAARQEFDYNKQLITMFQYDTNMYYRENGKLTTFSTNGQAVAIPSIAGLEKYVKLNIALSKLISELETDLDLEEGGGDDPF